MSVRVLIWTQHLLGLGHFTRATHIADALGQSGFEVVVANGGVRPPSPVASTYRLVDLPAVRAQDEMFDALVDAYGAPVSAHLLAQRRERLLALHDEVLPDCIITETFPFGRRLLQDEVMALLVHADRREQPPVVAASVRDVLQRPGKSERAAQMVARAQSHYDCVMVHSDPDVIPATVSFPEMARLGDLLHYTGYIGPARRHPAQPRAGVIVSAGGGKVGAALVETAIAARPMTLLANYPWTVVAGPLAGAPGESQPGVQLVRSLPDLADHIAGAVLSISQAGYNTMVEVLTGQTPSVVVPFETGREREQITRSLRLEALGLVKTIRAEDLSVTALASAIDEQHRIGTVSHGINLEGRAGTVAAIKALTGGR